MQRTNFTVAAICEGDAEVQLVRVVRDIFLPRFCGVSVRHHNAYGHGGAGALELAIRLKTEADYDAFGVIVDTDQHWTQADRQLAADNGILAIENAPCLERTLLSVHENRCPQSTRELKTAFERTYGGPPHREGVIRRNFSREDFEKSRARVEAIDRLLRLIRQ